MKNKILSVCIISLIATTFNVNALANTLITKSTDVIISTETEQLQSALDNSSLIKGFYNVRPNQSAAMDLDNDDVATEAVESFKIDAKKAVKLYSVSVNSEITSLKPQLDKENEQWLICQKINGKMSYIFIKKGDDIENAEKKINKLNISDKLKSSMLANARERAGKWYVSRIERPANITMDFDITENNSMISESSIVDTKFVYIKSTGMIAKWIQSDSGEQIIPYATPERLGNLENNTPYTLSEFSNNVLK